MPTSGNSTTETTRSFGALAEEYVECAMRFDPVDATEMGLHDYDDRLPDPGADGVAAQAAWLRDLEQRVTAGVTWEDLPPDQRVDYALLRSRIATRRADLEEIAGPRRDPVRYPETALRGVFLLMARAFAPLEERKEAVLARLMAIPGYLEAAIPQLDRVPAEFVGVAAEVNASGPLFVNEVVRALVAQFPGETERIEHAGSRARQGFDRYQSFLEQELPRRARGSFALGERWMNYKLEREHLLEWDCAALEAFGRDQIALARARLEREAARLDPGRSWREQIAAARNRCPEPLRVREAYEAEIERARRFVEARRIAPVPTCPLEVVDTPVFWRPTVPLGAYLPPGPFDVEPTGTFFVTPVDTARRPEEQQQQLAGHCYAALGITALHVAWPGHHLQLCHALQGHSRLRQLAQSPVFVEGWALYAEELMGEAGFLVDQASRLWQLRDELWRACRVVLDVALHTGRMSVAEAVAFLVEQALIERVNAETEVRRYLLTPTEPMSGVVGLAGLRTLRDEARRRMGDRYDAYTFHTALLAVGTLPLPLVREELWPALGVA